MSVVTSVILLASIIENGNDENPFPEFKKLNEWLIDRYGHKESGLQDITPAAGGWKSMEHCVFAGGYNWFDTKEFLLKVNSLNWLCPDDVMILIKEQDDDRFTVHRIK